MGKNSRGVNSSNSSSFRRMDRREPVKELCWKLFHEFENEEFSCMEMKIVVDYSLPLIEKDGLVPYMHRLSAELFNYDVKPEYIQAFFKFSTVLNQRLQEKSWYSTEQLIDVLTDILMDLNIGYRTHSWVFPFIVITLFFLRLLFV